MRSVISDIPAERLRLSEDVQPWQSFWYHRPTRNFPPVAIQHPESYDGSDRLAVACTQTGLSAKDQRRLVEQWCEFLPTLQGIRYLWLVSRTPQELFDAATRMPGLEGLYVKWGAIHDFRSVANLAELKALHIGGSPALEPLTTLHALPELEWLELHNVRATEDLSFVRGLPHLRGLSIAGDANSIKKVTVATLSPVVGLAELEWLSLSTIRLSDEDLDPIARLPKLRHLLISNGFRMEAFARLSGMVPHVDCDRFTPASEVLEGMACKRCRQNRMVMLTGKGKPFLCLDCDAARIEKHAREFQKIAASVQAAGHVVRQPVSR